MSTNYIFEYQGGGEVIPLFLEGEYNEDGSVKTLTINTIPEAVPVSQPRSPSITSYNMDTQTSATINWVAPSNINRPPITGYNIYREDDGGPLVFIAAVSNLVLTYQNTGMPVNTPNITFGFIVKAINSDGEGTASNKVLLQWAGTPTPQPPLAPFALTFSNVLTNNATLTWSQTADSSVTKNGIFRNGVIFRDNIPPTQISNLLTGLSSNTAYVNMTVRRYNSRGWSPDSNSVSFTTGSSSGITQDPVMGQSVPPDEEAYFTQLDAIRVYNLSDAVSKFNTFQPRVIGITDPGVAVGASAAFINNVQSMLETFYYGSGSSARQNCELHIANGNEVDRDYSSGSLPQGFIDAYSALRDLVWTRVGGVRRYPKASVWVDMTANNMKTTGAGPRFKPIARYIDGMAASFYPAGRTVQPSNPLIQYDPAGYPPGSIWPGLPRNAYPYYCDPIIDGLDDWRASGSATGGSLIGQLDSLACWEIGIPIHHSLDGMNLPNYVRTGANATDVTQRRAYLTGGARTSGPANQQYNFKGFLQYIYDECVLRNISMREMLYWNQQSNPLIPNPWRNDRNLTTPDSVTAWNEWTPGKRIPNI